MATLLNNDVILIVDDSKLIAQSYSRVAMSLGYRVLIARDGKTGLFCCGELQAEPNPSRYADAGYGRHRGAANVEADTSYVQHSSFGNQQPVRKECH
jgi:hypothetical protein